MVCILYSVSGAVCTLKEEVVDDVVDELPAGCSKAQLLHGVHQRLADGHDNLGLTAETAHEPCAQATRPYGIDLRQIAAPVLDEDKGDTVSLLEPKRQERLFLQHVQLDNIGQPAAATHGVPLTERVAEPLGTDHPHVATLRAKCLHVLLHEESAHGVLVRRIPGG